MIAQSSLGQVYQSQTQELAGEFVDVIFAFGLPLTKSNNQHGYDSSLDPVDDPVFLTHARTEEKLPPLSPHEVGGDQSRFRPGCEDLTRLGGQASGAAPRLGGHF